MECRIRLPQSSDFHLAVEIVNRLFAQSGLQSNDLSLAAFAQQESVLDPIVGLVPTLPIASLVQTTLHCNQLQCFIETSKSRCLRLVSNEIRLSVLPDLRRPDYNWDEKVSRFVLLSVWLRVPLGTASVAGAMVGDPTITEAIQRGLINAGADTGIEVNHCASLEGTSVTHIYSVYFASTMLSGCVEEVCRNLGVSELQVYARVESLRSKPRFASIQTFSVSACTPSREFNDMIPFACCCSIGPDNFSLPIPNIVGGGTFKHCTDTI